MTRPRQPSRHDERVDPDSTPPGGTTLDPDAPWYVRVIVRQADTIRDELRDIRARVESSEERLEEHGDRLEDTKSRWIKADVLEERRKPWERLFFVVAGGIIVGLALLAAGMAIGRCSSLPQPTKAEVKP